MFSLVTWHQALSLEKEYQRRGEKISVAKIRKALNVSENTGRILHGALLSKEIIRQDLPVDLVEHSTYLVFGDTHIPYHDKIAVDSMLTYADTLPSVDGIVILGDLIDFCPISSFLSKPTKKDMTAEIKEGRTFLTNLRERFPYSKIIYYTGNHEERLERYILQNAKELYGLVEDLLPTKLGLDKLDIELRSSIFNIGKLWYLHGHERKGGNPEYITNVIWKYLHDHFICAHFHRAQEKTFPHVTSKRYIGCSIGWLGTKEGAEYSRLNSWTQGFAIVKYSQNGDFKIENKTIIEGTIY